jgi:hypothetical protein
MKRLLTSSYAFDASTKQVTFTGIDNFDIKKLYAVLNITRNQIIYAIGDPEFGLSAISGNTITLVFDTTSQADTDTLGVIYDDVIEEIPSDDIDGGATAVRALPMHVSRIGFTKAIAGNVDSDWGAIVGSVGTGMAVNQTGGNLVITSGTTARAETIIRSTASWKGGIRLRSRVTLSQRIVNNNFFVELVDVIGDGLAYTIASATAITVTLPSGHGFTSQNVGQSMYLGGFVGTGTFLSGRYPIASVSGDNVTFTVSGFAAGTGTCSAFGWNYYQLQYQGTTATQTNFDTQRRGYASGATAATINTTASPGHLAIITANDLSATFTDQLVASTAVIQQTIRATRAENVPDDIPLRLQIRIANGATAPASTTTLTVGFVSISNFAAQDVSIQDIRPTSVVPLPVELIRGVATATQPVSGTVTANLGAATTRTGFIAGAGIWFDDSSTNLAANATFTGTSRDLTVTATATAWANAAAYGQEVVVSAESDATGTLWIEVSRDNAAWRRVKSIATTAVVGGGFYAEIVHRPSWRYVRVGFTNGVGAQTRFTIGSFLKAI